MLIIRRATPKDLQAIFDLHFLVIEQLETNPKTKGKAFHDLRTKDYILNTINEGLSLVTLYNGKVIAYSLFKRVLPNTIKADGAAVQKEFRGLGIQLMQYKLVKYLTKDNIQMITVPENTVSLNNILSLGCNLKTILPNGEHLYELTRN